MKKIAIYGAGGFGRETACLLREINEVSPMWDFVGFFDDGVPAGNRSHQGETLGGIDALNAWQGALALVFAIASPKTLETLLKKITNPNIEFPNIVAPTARILDRATLKLGKGNLINHGCTLSCDVALGDFNLLNEHVTIGHDSRLGNFNALMTGARIAGSVAIGNGNVFGMNAAVMQGTKIGNETTVGASSFVVRTPPDGSTCVGVPAIRLDF